MIVTVATNVGTSWKRMQNARAFFRVKRDFAKKFLTF